MGAKAESHAGDAAEFGVDVSFEVVSNGSAPEEDADEAEPDAVVAPQLANGAPKFDTLTILKNRNSVSEPAILPVMPASTKAMQVMVGRPDKPGELRGFAALRPMPDHGETSIDPFTWLRGRLAHNPIALVFYTTDTTGKKTPIPLVLPSGDTTDDSAIHRACVGHSSHCIVLVCKPETAVTKEPCAKTMVDSWQSIATSRVDSSLEYLLEKLVKKRATTPALQGMAISRIDVSQNAPRIVRSRLTPKAP